MNFEHPQAAKL